MTVDILEAVTGWGMSEAELNEVFERGITMARLFNQRCGFTDADDKLPPRFLEPLKTGPFADKPLTRESVRKVVEDYYDDARLGRLDGHPEGGDAGEAWHLRVRHGVRGGERGQVQELVPLP